MSAASHYHTTNGIRKINPEDWYGATSNTRRYLDQTGNVVEGAAPHSGFVVGPNASGEPSYQYRIDARAPLAEPSGSLTGDAATSRWAATFQGNSPIGIAAGYEPTDPLEAAISSAETYHANNNIPLPTTRTINPVVSATLRSQGRDTQGNYQSPIDRVAQGQRDVAPYADFSQPFRTDLTAKQDYSERLKNLALPDNSDLMESF